MATETTLHLHRAQSRVYASPARFRVLVAGRRWGKSHLMRVLLLSAANARGLLWYIAPTYDQARDVMWEPLKATIPPDWLRRPPNESRFTIDLKSGTTIALKSAENPDHLRGRGLAGVLLDEYQDMDPIIWTEVIAPSLLDTGGWGVFGGTPKSFNHLYDAYQRGQSSAPEWSDWASWQFKSIDAAKPNGHLDPGMIESFRATLDPRSFRQEFEASFEALAGRVYYAFDRGVHVRTVTLNPNLPAYLSFDFNIDPSAAVIAQLEGPHVRVWREVKTRHAGGEATRATAKRVRELLSQAGHVGQVRVYGDATGKAGKTTGPADHAVLREVFARASWCIPSANPHVRDRIAAVNGRCHTMTGERYLTIDPSAIGLAADLEQVIFAANGDIDKQTNPELTHLSDCLGYLCAKEFPAVTRAFTASNFAFLET